MQFCSLSDPDVGASRGKKENIYGDFKIFVTIFSDSDLHTPLKKVAW